MELLVSSQSGQLLCTRPDHLNSNPSPEKVIVLEHVNSSPDGGASRWVKYWNRVDGARCWNQVESTRGVSSSAQVGYLSTLI